MKQVEEEPTKQPARVVRVTSVVTVVLVFAAGVVCASLAGNLLAKENITFSTQSLVSLVFTVALGAASIVLALIAVSITRKGEDALIRRSDEGIKLQNDAFVKTTEVLSQIRASTGVTEKRIEDIISGRSGVIAKEVVERSLPKQEAVLTKETTEKITKGIADSLKQELFALVSSPPAAAEEKLTELAAKQTKTEEIEARWGVFRKSVVDALKGLSGVKVIRDKEGSVYGDDEASFWDAVLQIGHKRVGLDVHIQEQVDARSGYFDWETNPNTRTKFVRRLTWRIAEDAIDFVFVVFDKNVWKQKGMEHMAGLLDRFNEGSSKSRIVRLTGDPQSIAKQIHSTSVGKQSHES